MGRVLLLLAGATGAVYYGVTLGPYAAVPVVLCTALFVLPRRDARPIPPLGGDVDPGEVKRYRIAHPGTGILEAVEAVRRSR